MVFGLLAPIRGLGQAGFEPNGGTTIGPSRGLGRFQGVKLPEGGWLRIRACRAGDRNGRPDSRSVGPKGCHWCRCVSVGSLDYWHRCLVGCPGRPRVGCVVSGPTGGAFAEGDGSERNWVFAGVVVLRGDLPVGILRGAMGRRVSLLPLFPLLFVATAVALRDGYVDVRHAKATGFKFSLGFIRELEDAELLVPIVYGVTAVILLAHPFLFRFSPVIRGGLDFSIAGRMWPERFTYLQTLAGLALLSAAIFRKAARPLSDSVAFNGSIIGCLYGVWALDKLGEYIGIVRRFSGPSPVSRLGETVPWILLAASLVPLLFALFLAVLDLKKSESAGQVILRAAGCFCFVAFLFSGYLDRYAVLALALRLTNSTCSSLGPHICFVLSIPYLRTTMPWEQVWDKRLSY